MTPTIDKFNSADDAWFWFIRANNERMTAKPDPSARMVILRIVDRMYRQRKLSRDHLLVLSHYGRRQSAPRPDALRETNDHAVWVQALELLTPAFREKDIVQ